ncbi:hypothetical protein MKW94_014085 [Papaver nudicaule]|uniref:Heat shock protein 90 n=1 Tax=Papaver nudicaule TaxID=74823 RepID=A0AA41RUK6_PAPNU|nr:hypothetical protein [Papaver nudicaule]
MYTTLPNALLNSQKTQNCVSLISDPQIQNPRIISISEHWSLFPESGGTTTTLIFFFFIARSGTKEFLEALAAGADVSMIAQFGVCFYFAYPATDKVIVTAKHNEDEHGDTSGEVLGRGAKIALVLKDGYLEYLEEHRLKDLVKKHFDFISYPIYLWTEKTTEKEISDDEDEEKKDEQGKVEDASHEWAEANDITKEEHAAFYKSLINDWEHLSLKHFEVEGHLEFEAVLFVPKRAPCDLYVRLVFIMDNCEDIIPEYLSFVKGIVDSEDLHINIFLRDRLKKKDSELLYIVDAIDEYAVGQLMDYEGKKIVSATKEDLKLEKNEDEKKKAETSKEKFADLCKVIKEVLGDRVEKEFPCVLVTGEYMVGLLTWKKTMEIDPENSIMEELRKMTDAAAILTSGFSLEEPITFGNRIHRMLKLGLNIDEHGADIEAYPEMPELG